MLRSVERRLVSVAAVGFFLAAQPLAAETLGWSWEPATFGGTAGWTLSDQTISVEAGTEVCVLPPSYYQGALRYYVGGYDDGSIWWLGTTVPANYPACKVFPAGGEVTIGSDTSFTANAPFGPGTITYTPGAGVADPEWQTDTISSTGSMGAYNSIAVDASGHPHVSYYDWTYYDLKYAYHDGSSWHTTTVDGAGVDLGNYTTIALDSAGMPHIAYRSNEGVKYAYMDGSGWHTEIVIPVVAGSPTIIYTEIAMALDNSDRPHIAYVAGDNPYYANPVMYYTSQDGSGGWLTPETVDIPGNYIQDVSLAVDGGDTPHIGYIRDSNLWYARRGGMNSWTSEQVTQPVTQEYPARKAAIAVDSTGVPHISYEHVSAWWGGLRYAYRDPSLGWQISPVDTLDGTGYDPTYSDNYYDTSIAIDGNDNPHIAYNGYPDILKYASYDGSAWNVESVDDGSSFSQYLDIALSPDNDPHISYFHPGSPMLLKYAVLQSPGAVDPDTEDDGINDTIDGYVLPLTTNFIDESAYYSSSFTDMHLGGTTYGEIIDRSGLDVYVDDLSLSGVVIHADGDPFSYALINICGIPYGIYGGDIATFTCGSSTARVLDGMPEARLDGGIVIGLPDGSLSTIDTISGTEYSVANDAGSLAPLTVDIGGSQSEIGAGETETLNTEVSSLEVAVDVQPGSSTNCLNINGHGTIPVAILGSSEFDVSWIDVETLSFSGLDLRIRGNDRPQCSFEDVSGDFSDPAGLPDGYLDLVCHFVDNPDYWVPEDGTAYVSGTLLPEFGGTEFSGSDTICIVP